MDHVSEDQRRWEKLGTTNPYWTVCTEDRFRCDRMGEVDREEFFASGARELSETIERIERHLQPSFAPALSLDYGCGVGRLTFPIARVSGRVIGVDVSDRMLAIAADNAAGMGIRNVVFQRPSEALIESAPDLDFVHSYIVFQHIPPGIGMRVTDALLRRLKPGGVAALHYTFSRETGLLRKFVHRARRSVPGVNVLVNALQGRALTEPMIPLYDYDAGALIGLLAEHGCTDMHLFYTQHGRHLGAMILCRKASTMEAPQIR